MTLFSSSFAVIEILKYIAGLIDVKESYKVRGELLFSDLKITYLNVAKKKVYSVINGEVNDSFDMYFDF